MSDHLPKRPAVAPEPEHFRRRQFVAPHRRRKLVLRLLRPFLVALAIVGLPSVLVAWILFSEQFAVREVSVTSGGRVSTEWAGERLASIRGRSLLAIDIDDVESALSGHPWIEGVLLHRRPPDRLQVDILEKQPAALLVRDHELVFVDASGQMIGAYDPVADPGGLVVLSTASGRSDLVHSGVALVDDWKRRKLPWAEELSEVHVLTATDFRVVIAVLPLPVLVSSGHLAESLASLIRYTPQIERRLADVLSFGAIDLRFQGRIVFQPAVMMPPNLEGETNA